MITKFDSASQEETNVPAAWTLRGVDPSAAQNTMDRGTLSASVSASVSSNEKDQICLCLVILFVFYLLLRMLFSGSSHPPTMLNVTVAIKPSMGDNVGSGLQCSDNYFPNAPARILPVGFCKLYIAKTFKLDYIIYPGKYFADQSECFAFSEREFSLRNLPPELNSYNFNPIRQNKIEFLHYDESRLRFTEAHGYELTQCDPLIFRMPNKLTLVDTLSGNYINEQMFLIGRAFVFSDVCKEYQWIPAWWSVNYQLCFYHDVRYGKPNVTTECQILCNADTFLPQEDPWLKTNAL